MKIKEVTGDYSMSGTRRMQAPGNLRSGFATRGSRSSLEKDLEDIEWKERQDRVAASIVYLQHEGKILAVSRGEDLTNMNMPGGGVEPGESPEAAAVRELEEETGLRAMQISPVFSKREGDKIIYFFKVNKFSGELKSSHEGIAKWVDPNTLLRGQYADSFLDVISRL